MRGREREKYKKYFARCGFEPVNRLARLSSHVVNCNPASEYRNRKYSILM
jgi:hypothetical protein